MNRHPNWIQVEFIKGSRTFANSCWACILVCGATGFLLVGLSSCIGQELTPLSYKQIAFIPQGLVMCFYGLAGLFLGLYLLCTILWDVGSGYNYFDRREGCSSIFRWGFPGKNRRIHIQLLLRDIEAIGLKNQEGFFPNRILYLKVRGQRSIPLTRIGENSTSEYMEKKAAELARFLRVSIEGF
uniref:Photosystem I assembly protein Ycf4 n=2 Tax=Vittaria TaxID=32183 RepID=A0A3G5CUS4_9MONI|nr:photosystem I assembly protein Ycf4 [Vittaria graminifolia]YP_009549456.1 photosystem I assembly protein Ycf4 [Vittaria appalachiana]AYW16432.1 photosystem I assembly protein Ycf4 [Vittaria graminifolia]AYW16605.1 photosystem I assembly protein Ycf4 [Vittaria appalachiana]